MYIFPSAKYAGIELVSHSNALFDVIVYNKG